MKFNTYHEAAAAWQADRVHLEQLGISFEAGAEPKAYLPEPFKRNYQMALDAQPALITDPNGGIPALLTTYIDPTVYQVIFAPLLGAEILGESRRGTWIDQTILFPTVEHVGEVSSYGDYAMNGRADVNMTWPARQAYLFQTFIECGDLEVDRAGAGRIGLVAEKNNAAATVMNRALDITYHYGVRGLQNYGLLNDPNLTAALTPSTKTAGGVTWFTVGGAPNATAQEVYNDILALFGQLLAQTAGRIRNDDRLVLVMPSQLSSAFGFINAFGQSVRFLIENYWHNLRIVFDPLYGARTTLNPTGSLGGNVIQLIAESMEGQDTGTCAFNEKMRSHRVVPHESSFRQKKTSGTWGAVIRQPFAVAQMIGI